MTTALPGHASGGRVTPAVLDEDRSMATFIIHTHGRLQEWVAEEKGYFAAEGLTDYALSSHGLLARNQVTTPTEVGVLDKRYGAYQTYEQGREASVSCACHWTVNEAVAKNVGRMWGNAYSVMPAAIMVASCRANTAMSPAVGFPPPTLPLCDLTRVAATPCRLRSARNVCSLAARDFPRTLLPRLSLPSQTN